ncbi:hypothetical protein EJ02DRAFT_432600 [Clathrospora elynae]|uniref:SRR1-like domain-containing protein n=1 Tax=Clathrospora elynae TaxID=706981 RepID=A0A6A5SX48_9PLEO|nr:hypothetical protein EJ02DRAFT_432600 [Clathrospora elynae]
MADTEPLQGTAPNEAAAAQPQGQRSDPPADKILDIKAFLESLDNRPIFTRKLFQNASEQLAKARTGQEIELVDCYGSTQAIATKDNFEAGRAPHLQYNSIHILADNDPYPTLRQFTAGLQAVMTRSRRDNVEAMVRYSNFPIYISFCENEDEFDYHLDDLVRDIADYTTLWDKSIERAVLAESLHQLKHTARITNIICIGHGSLDRGPASLLQHICASAIAQELTALYNEDGEAPKEPITIIAQDPTYTANDRELLSRLSCPIRVVPDPEAFLAVNESSLIMACYPTIPVKQILPDLAADSLSGKGPAAMFLNNEQCSNGNGGVDVVTAPWRKPLYYANAPSRPYLKMRAVYTKIMDGKKLFGSRFSDEYFETMYGIEDEGVEDVNNIQQLVQSLYKLAVGDDEEEATSEEEEAVMRGQEAASDGEDAVSDSGPRSTASDESGPALDWLPSMQIWARPK